MRNHAFPHPFPSASRYLALHLLGAGLGRALRAPPPRADWRARARALWALDAALWAAALAARAALGPVSRRLCNASYALWTLALATQLLATLLSLEVLVPAWLAPRAPCAALVAALNRNQLALFLVANLLTGAANLAMRTLDVGPARSFAVLAAYLAAVLGCATAWDAADLTLRFW